MILICFTVLSPTYKLYILFVLASILTERKQWRGSQLVWNILSVNIPGMVGYTIQLFIERQCHVF